MGLKLFLLAACIQASLLISLTGAAPSKKYEGKYNAIPYEVIKKTDEYEVRRYPSFRYATARETKVSMMTANGRNFRKLFAYIQGKNEGGEKIPMTVPVLCSIMKDGSPGGYAEDFNMMFWLPQKYQCLNCPPTPSKATEVKDQVLITMWGERIAYVRRYGWWAFPSLIKYNEGKLRESLDADGVKGGVDYDPSTVHSASYNSPWQIFGRRNEVMFMQMQHDDTNGSNDELNQEPDV